jgi:hypothetical protein
LFISVIAYSQSAYQSYVSELSKQVVFNIREAPDFAFTKYSEAEYKQLYYKNYPEYERVRHTIIDSKRFTIKYLDKILQTAGDEKHLIKPSQWINLSLNDSNKKPIFYAGNSIKQKIITENDKLLNECQGALLKTPDNAQLKAFYLKLSDFNGAIKRWGTSEFTSKDMTNLTEFYSKYIR